MPQAKCSDNEFIDLFQTAGASGVSEKFSMPQSNVYRRRRRLEIKYNKPINAPLTIKTNHSEKYPQRAVYEIENGMVPIGSDAHIWPGPQTTAQRAFIRFCEKYKSEIPLVILNGDIFDGARISRFGKIGWENKPTVKDELIACKAFTNEIENVTNAEYVWPLGNHDARFETYLSNSAPELVGVDGAHLKDHFPNWKPCWSTWINDDVVVKHRWKGGVHATHNNTVNSGKTMVTGHLHSQKVTPFSDYNGTRWGVDSGTMADPYTEQFADYTEDSPVNWGSGFAVLTFRDGELLPPELVQVWGENKVVFRGEIHAV